MDHTPKQDMLTTVGDWTTKVENKVELNAVEKFGLRVRNKPGDQLLVFCEANNLCISSTCFKQPTRRIHVNIAKWSI